MPKRIRDNLMEVKGTTPKQEVANNLYVTFSKRRKGLFNKAGTLCAKYGAQVAVLVLSPTGNPSAFGHTTVEEVLQCYSLRQMIPNYPLVIGNNGGLIDKPRDQVRQIEGLKARIKQAQNSDGCSLKNLMAWVEREWEACKTVEELEFLKQKYLALLENVRNRFMRSPSTIYATSADHHGLFNVDVRPLSVMGPQNDMSYLSEKKFVYHHYSGEEGNIKSIGTTSGTHVQESLENCFWDFTHYQNYLIGSNHVGMASHDCVSFPYVGGLYGTNGGDFSNMDQVFCNGGASIF